MAKNIFHRIAASLREAVFFAEKVSMGPGPDEIIDRLPSILSFTEPKRSMDVFRELEKEYGDMSVSLGAVYIALDTAGREGWVRRELSTQTRSWGRRNVLVPVYFKQGSGRRIKPDVQAAGLDIDGRLKPAYIAIQP